MLKGAGAWGRRTNLVSIAGFLVQDHPGLHPSH